MSPVPDPSGEHTFTVWGVALLALERGAAVLRAVTRLLKRNGRDDRLARIEFYAKSAATDAASLNRKKFRDDHPGMETPSPEVYRTNHGNPLPLPPELEEKAARAQGVEPIPAKRKP